VTITTTEEQAAMRESFRRLLSQRGTETDVRRAMASEPGYDPALWRQIADMGIAGIIIDPAHGGLGAGPVELELIMEEAGAALLCSPLLSSGVLAAGLLQKSSDPAACARLLPGIASGERIATVALTGEHPTWTPEGVSVSASLRGNQWRLDGVATYVTSGNNADTLLVVARTDAGYQTFEVDAKADGLAIAPLQTFDRTLRLSRMNLNGVEGTPIAGADWAAIEGMLDLARVALAGEQAGGARRAFDMSIDYIKTRVQFGRPVGGFQALKHMAADLLLEVESATSAARRAAEALADGANDAEALVNLAGFACADAFTQVAAAAIQMHGGIGFTWDHPAHLFLRRARADAQLFGPPAFYRERYISILERAG
jgi:alkylation response protein AidB-like acyl-CoA dehydrogenase